MEARLLYVLRQIRSGVNDFKPKDESPEEVRKFQPIANAVIHAHEMGYVRDAKALVSSIRGDKYFRAVLTFGGLTYLGEEALADEIGHPGPIEDLVDEITLADKRSVLQDHWDRAIQRSRNDPRGAITAANSFLEAVMKWIVEQNGGAPPENRKKLFELTMETVNSTGSEVPPEISDSIETLIREIGVLRSKIGDAHGSRSESYSPTATQALLSINLAGTIAIFLLDTFEDLSSRHYP